MAITTGLLLYTTLICIFPVFFLLVPDHTSSRMKATCSLLSQQDISWFPVWTWDYEASGSSIFLETNTLERSVVSV